MQNAHIILEEIKISVFYIMSNVYWKKSNYCCTDHLFSLHAIM